MKIKLLIAILAISLVGCAGHRKHNYQYKYDAYSGKFNNGYAAIAPEQQLTDAVTSLSQSLQDLAKLERAMHPGVILPPPTSARKLGMTNRVSVDWVGPIEPLVKSIAQRSNYKLNVLGNAPAIPIIVTIHARNETLATILRNIGYQCVHSAKIVVYPAHKIIELRYAKI